MVKNRTIYRLTIILKFIYRASTQTFEPPACDKSAKSRSTSDTNLVKSEEEVDVFKPTIDAYLYKNKQEATYRPVSSAYTRSLQTLSDNQDLKQAQLIFDCQSFSSVGFLFKQEQCQANGRRSIVAEVRFIQNTTWMTHK